MKSITEPVGRALIRMADETGRMIALFSETILLCRYVLHQFRRTAVQLVRVGPESLPIAGMMALFTGIVLAMHSGYALREYGSEAMLSTIVALSMVKEMGPVLTGMLVAGRMGAAFAAEIGTMRVNEEIDALETLGINPVRYLCVPRLTACLVMVPALVVFAEIVGILGGLIVASAYFDIPVDSYFDSVFRSVDVEDVAEGLVKALVFGMLIATISCYRGLQTRGGARGVGEAITRCVVQCFVWIFVSNYFVTRFFVSG